MAPRSDPRPTHPAPGIAAGVWTGLAILLGGGALILFGWLVVVGPLRLVDLGLGRGGRLAFDAALCLLFFAQHSVMVRTSFRRPLRRVLHPTRHGALYAISSGIALGALVLLWQASPAVRAASAEGWVRVGLRALLVPAGLLLLWGASALGRFDPLGIAPLWQKSGASTADGLAARGPYRWVRHPLYLAFLVALWAAPDVTPDRLLLNGLWTVWIVVGCVLEERDLVTEYGDAYRAYQRRVPMLVPRFSAPAPDPPDGEGQGIGKM